ncbi:MAG: redox-regulated ATPase YchF [Candidatus Roizmanbacteria bacterium]|nr:redox-regulated ATPase YchF [Candidatus Roizmanbacteria bacterium]
MNLSIGIVGLPNVGKSTLFNALLKKTVAFTANYPFATIEPNVGVVEVPDDRLPIIAKVVNTQKIVPAVVEFYDIAGLVKGASTGEGLGNKFLSHIREVAAIAHVVRLFEDGDIIHVQDTVDALRDIQTIETELIFADLATLFKQKEPKGKFSKEEGIRYDAIIKLKNHLNAGSSARTLRLTDDEAIQAKDLQLLTMKPEIFVFNVSEEQLMEKKDTEQRIASIMKYYTTPSDMTSETPPYKGGEFKQDSSPPYQGGVPAGGGGFIYLNAKLENDVLAFEEADQKEYLNQYNLEETGLNRLIKTAYETLGLISFLTGGDLEARAWTLRRGETALRASSVIHTDFEKKFIKADIVPFDDFTNLGGWKNARENGAVQIVGKEYVMKDGDVVEFKIGQ